ARANAIKGVAGMRSYLFWVDAVRSGVTIRNSLYHKVLYKMTTDPQELAILEQALESHGLIAKLDQLDEMNHFSSNGANQEVMEIDSSQDGEFTTKTNQANQQAVRFKKSKDREGHSNQDSHENTNISSNDQGENSTLFHHELDQSTTNAFSKKEFRKQLNRKARQSVQGSCHEEIKLIVHRPEVT